MPVFIKSLAINSFYGCRNRKRDFCEAREYFVRLSSFLAHSFEFNDKHAGFTTRSAFRQHSERQSDTQKDNDIKEKTEICLRIIVVSNEATKKNIGDEQQLQKKKEEVYAKKRTYAEIQKISTEMKNIKIAFIIIRQKKIKRVAHSEKEMQKQPKTKRKPLIGLHNK